ncbi:hypothetical protein T492DRAFT_1099525 [Pavlovales sp. CCMP2436]|nr:hypothetical protein T492DRAFT_1099525 [Pavlovales sp. CCMP2436]
MPRGRRQHGRQQRGRLSTAALLTIMVIGMTRGHPSSVPRNWPAGALSGGARCMWFKSALSRVAINMAVDPHDVSEGDLIVFENAGDGGSGGGDSPLSCGVVIATAGCTVWAQPLCSHAVAVANEDAVAAASWVQLFADEGRDIVQLQAGIEQLLKKQLLSDVERLPAGEVWIVRRDALPPQVTIPML